MRAKITLIVIIAVIAYAVLGGVAFHYIEQGHELQLLPEVITELSVYADDNNKCLNWSDVVQLQGLLQNLADGGLYIDPLSDQIQNGTKWDIRTAILAAVSVLTSVGYHNLSPDFTGARIFLIFYGWLGIPLFFSAAIVFGKIALKAMDTAGKRLCGKYVPPKAMFILNNIIYQLIGFSLFILVPAAIFSHLERWNYGDALYFCMLTVITIGFGELMPGFNRDVLPSDNFMYWYRLAIAFWVLILVMWHLSQITRIIHEIDVSSEKSETQIEEKIEEEIEYIKKNQPTIPGVNWARGASAVIRGGAGTNLPPPPSSSNIYPAIGSSEHLPVNSSSLVNVLSVGET